MDTQDWINYFESNRGTYTEPDWSAKRFLPDGKKLDLLRKSLATFKSERSLVPTVLALV